MTRLFSVLMTLVITLSVSFACARGQESKVLPSAETAKTANPPAAAPDPAKPASAAVDPQPQIVQDFKTRVDAYVEMRKKADDGVKAQKETSDPKQIRERQTKLATNIQSMRQGAKPGDIFTPEIRAHFRRLLRPELKEADTKAAIKDDNPGAFPFKVNGPYPEEEPLSTMPPNVLASLPQLPEEIEFRFVGKHLILRDARANIIIDYIPNAIS